ncbi:MAG TPA: hypothetical protein VG028_16520 [Terriglobia bacterium]|nr:hypothetical protein [Terriglobia bacterium]
MMAQVKWRSLSISAVPLCNGTHAVNQTRYFLSGCVASTTRPHQTFVPQAQTLNDGCGIEVAMGYKHLPPGQG